MFAVFVIHTYYHMYTCFFIRLYYHSRDRDKFYNIYGYRGAFKYHIIKNYVYNEKNDIYYFNFIHQLNVGGLKNKRFHFPSLKKLPEVFLFPII